MDITHITSPGAGADVSLAIAGVGCAALFVVECVHCRFFAKEDRLDDVVPDELVD